MRLWPIFRAAAGLMLISQAWAQSEAAPVPPNSATTTVSDDLWNQWRTALADASPEKRAAAEAEIIKHAGVLRERIRAAWLGADKAEVRQQLGRVWSHVRWQVIPGFTAADAVPLQGSFGDPDVVIAWDKAIERFGAPLVRVMIEVRQSPGLTSTASSACARLCARLAPEEVAAAIADAVRDAGHRDEYVRLLLDAARPPADAIAIERMAGIALRMEWYHDAFEIARGGFERFDDFPLDAAVTSAQRGDFAGTLVNEMRSLVGDRSNRITPRTWIFYIRLMDRLGQAKDIPPEVPAGLVEGWPPDRARELVSCLLEMRRLDVARKVAGNSESAVTAYLHYIILNRETEGAGSEAAQVQLNLAISRAEQMEEGGALLLKIGEWLDRDAGSPELAWERLLKKEGLDTEASATAALRLADRRERAGKLDEAIELYARALRAARQPGAKLTLRLGNQTSDGVPIIEAKIRDLRKRLESEKR